MRLMCLLVLLASLVCFSGCAARKGYPKRMNNLEEELKYLSEYYCYEQVLDDYNCKIDPKEKKAFRNEVVNARIRIIDIYFNKFEQELTTEHIEMNIVSDVAVIALNAVGAAVPAVAATRILSLISGGIVGARGVIDKELYFQKTLPAFLAAMESQRKSVLVRIRSGLTLKPDEYPLSQALIDLEDYFKAGSIPGALMNIIETSGDASTQSDRELNEIVIGKYVRDEAGDMLRQFWKPDGKNISKDNEAAIKKWLEENVPEEFSIANFLRDEKYKEARKKAVKKLWLWAVEKPTENARDEAGDMLRQFLKPDGKNINKDNEAAIKKWLEENVPEEFSITNFLRDEKYKEARKRAVREIKQRRPVCQRAE